MEQPRIPGESAGVTAIGTALCMLGGAVLATAVPRLPALSVDLLGMLLGLVLLGLPRWRNGRHRGSHRGHRLLARAAPWIACLGGLLLGLCWAMLRGDLAMRARLPPALEGRDVLVEGQLTELPRADLDAWRFVLRIDRASLDGQPLAWRGQARLAWYAPLPSDLPPCGRWRLLLRLRRPRGLLNPDGVDSERAALEHGIDAVGYVRAGPVNRSLGASSWCIDALRGRIATAIATGAGAPRDIALLQAFSVGDTRGLGEVDWSVARANGIPHLIAISGFHIGIAAIFGVLLLRGGYWLWPALGQRWPRPQASALLALPCALAYGALAGLSLPTVRTLLMIATLALAHAWRRRGNGGHSLALAALLIVVVDPLAVLSPGFWLSFVGVVLLMLCLRTRGAGLAAKLRELVTAQLLMSGALLPLGLWFFGEASLIGALANWLAEPLVSFLIVPLALLGVVGFLLWPPLSVPCWWAARWLIHAHWWLLERMAQWPGAHWHPPRPTWWAVLAAMVGAVWLFMPRGMPLRALAPLLWLPLLCIRPLVPARGAFELSMLDVGQGLAVLLRTHQHALLYDAGARYRSGFDLGAAVVTPSLLALGVNRLDLLMISHGDNDHAGGAAAVARAFPSARGLAGEPQRTHPSMPACQRGQHWHWDDIDFMVLQPTAASAAGNDRSCVLLVSGVGGRVLLTGDIDAAGERAVIAVLPPGLPPVLLVPHHGSKTSSSADFLHALSPSLALVSSGWHNRFGHPHPLVVERYRSIGASLLNTADSGAITVDFPRDGPPQLRRRERLMRGAYWREQ